MQVSPASPLIGWRCRRGAGRRPCCQGGLALPGPSAASGFVCQAREALGKKPPHPLVDKAAADADRRGNGADGHPLGPEEQQTPSTRQTCRERRGPLPGAQGLPVGRGEAERQRGEASRGHRATFPEGSVATRATGHQGADRACGHHTDVHDVWPSYRPKYAAVIASRLWPSSLLMITRAS